MVMRRLHNVIRSLQFGCGRARDLLAGFDLYTPTSSLLVVLVTAAGTCALAAQESHTVRDSAGIAIVENTGPAWSEGQRWSLGTEPTLRIGTVEGDLDYIFERVRGATRMDDGTIVVLEGGTNELRLDVPFVVMFPLHRRGH